MMRTSRRRGRDTIDAYSIDAELRHYFAKAGRVVNVCVTGIRIPSTPI